MKHRAIFLDRDGTINRDLGHVHRVNQLRLVDNAALGLARMAAQGFRLIIVTNQSGIARRYFTEADLHQFHQTLRRRLQVEGVDITAIYHCPFHPTAGVDEFRQDSHLRKPRPGMLLQAATDHDLDLSASFMIGDRKTDVQAGAAAGCRTVLVRTGPVGEFEAGLTAKPDFVAHDLRNAAAIIQRASGEAHRVPLAPLGTNFSDSAARSHARGFAL